MTLLFYLTDTTPRAERHPVYRTTTPDMEICWTHDVFLYVSFLCAKSFGQFLRPPVFDVPWESYAFRSQVLLPSSPPRRHQESFYPCWASMSKKHNFTVYDVTSFVIFFGAMFVCHIGRCMNLCWFFSWHANLVGIVLILRWDGTEGILKSLRRTCAASAPGFIPSFSHGYFLEACSEPLN